MKTQHRTPTTTPAPATDQQGSVLMWALLFSVLASAMIISHATYLASTRKEMSVRFENVTLADTFARSGLTEALSWYQKQPVQPVTAFHPQYDPSGDPPMLETLDPTIGLVREFEVRGNLWARYEVRTSEAYDVSTERGQTTPGTVWDIGSRGFLFVRANASVPFDQGPNRVVATNYLRSEMRGIPLVPPAQAAVTMDEPGTLDLGPNGWIEGGPGPGLAYPDSKSAPATAPGKITGTPSLVGIVQYRSGSDDVFDMHMEDLKSLSDYVVDDFTGTLDTLGGALLGGDGGDGGLLLPQEPESSWNWWNTVTNTTTTTTTNLTESTWSWWESLSTTTETTINTALSFTTTTASAAPTVSSEMLWIKSTRNFAPGVGRPQLRTRRQPLQSKSLFINRNVVLDATRSLNGNALVVIRGDLTVQADNVTRLRGILYVTGDAVIDGDFELRGMLIVRGQLRLGHAAATSKIIYDPTVVQRLKRNLERYRVSRSIRPGWSR